MHELAFANYAETFMSSDSFEMQKKINAVEPAGIDLAGRAAAYLLDNLDGRVTIGELSGFVGVSPTYLKTAFREKYGMPVYRWYKVEKMKEASRLLAETDMSIMDIASDLGYSNASKFAAAYRSVTGMQPALYRQIKRKM